MGDAGRIHAQAAVIIPVLQRGETGRGVALHRPIRAEELIELLNTESARRPLRRPRRRRRPRSREAASHA